MNLFDYTISLLVFLCFWLIVKFKLLSSAPFDFFFLCCYDSSYNGITIDYEIDWKIIRNTRCSIRIKINENCGGKTTRAIRFNFNFCAAAGIEQNWTEAREWGNKSIDETTQIHNSQSKQFSLFSNSSHIKNHSFHISFIPSQSQSKLLTVNAGHKFSFTLKQL